MPRYIQSLIDRQTFPLIIWLLGLWTLLDNVMDLKMVIETSSLWEWVGLVGEFWTSVSILCIFLFLCFECIVTVAVLSSSATLMFGGHSASRRKRATGSSEFQGRISRLVIVPRVLSSADIGELFTGGTFPSDAVMEPIQDAVQDWSILVDYSSEVTRKYCFSSTNCESSQGECCLHSNCPKLTHLLFLWLYGHWFRRKCIRLGERRKCTDVLSSINHSRDHT